MSLSFSLHWMSGLIPIYGIHRKALNERREPRSLIARGEQREPLVLTALVSMGRGTGRLLWLLNEAAAPAAHMFFWRI